jgi:gamma-glutamyltranspeptidase/glutathione hydrolase
VVPAACDAWLTTLELYGTMSFEQVVSPALELADKGFVVYPRLATAIQEASSQLGAWPESASVFMPNGRPLRCGERLVRKSLADLFRRLADVERSVSKQGREQAIRAARDHFYKGDIASRIARFCQEEGGILTEEDLARFDVKVEPPEVGSYKDHRLYTCGPWCQGPTFIQVLNLLEGLDLRTMGHNSSDYMHVLTEAVKLAFSDRHAFYGDPEFVDVPMEGLLSKDYAAQRRQMIHMREAWSEMPPPGNPNGLANGERICDGPSASSGPWEADTSYTCVVDRWGNVFSATPSDGELGSPMVPGLGIPISTRGSQSWLEKDHPSSVAPWKRPRLTPNPAIVLKGDGSAWPLGTPAGDAQVQAMVQAFLNVVEFDMDPQQAIEEPRFISHSFPNSFWPHTYLPGQLSVEGRAARQSVEDLKARGHKIEVWPDWTPAAGGMCMIVADRTRGILSAGADPRRESYALGR